MQAHEAVILILVVLSLLGGFGWIIYSSLRLLWPKGKRYTESYPGPGTGGVPYQVHVIFEEGVKADRVLAMHAAKAVWATGAAWMLAKKDGRVTDDDHRLIEVIVVFATGASMDKMAKEMGYKSLAGRGTVHRMRQWWPFELPIAYISERNIEEVRKNGEPVIHEMVHTVAGHLETVEMEGHVDPILWAAARHKEGLDEPSVQERAGDIYTSQPGRVFSA